jgi:uncharacterized protein YktA (UPF0223 family)
MKRNSVSPQGKSKSRSLTRSASAGLIDYIQSKYSKKIPIAALTAAQKIYGKLKPIKKDDKIIQRLAEDSSNLSTAKIVEYLGKAETHEKGKPLGAEALKRVFESYGQDNKLSFEYIMKMGENTGIQINQKIAKAIIRKYGKRKDHINIEDCFRINERRQKGPKSPAKK